MNITIKYPFVPKVRSLACSLVMDTFGVDFDQGEHVVAEKLELDILPGQIVLFTGPSGSGKSSLLRAVVAELGRDRRNHLVDIDRLTLPGRPLVEALPLPLRESLDLLAACGLSEAQLLLRTPGELSEGQRYRFRLALGVAELAAGGGRVSSQLTANSSQLWRARCDSDGSSLEVAGSSGRLRSRLADAARWLIADELTAILDRTLAQVLAYNLGRLARRLGIGCLLATTHEDVVVDLHPDVWVRPELDGRIGIERRGQG